MPQQYLLQAITRQAEVIGSAKQVLALHISLILEGLCEATVERRKSWQAGIESIDAAKAPKIDCPYLHPCLIAVPDERKLSSQLCVRKPVGLHYTWLAQFPALRVVFWMLMEGRACRIECKTALTCLRQLSLLGAWWIYITQPHVRLPRTCQWSHCRRVRAHQEDK